MCHKKKQLPIKRCKHFELGGDKKRKVLNCIIALVNFCLCTMLQFVHLSFMGLSFKHYLTLIIFLFGLKLIIFTVYFEIDNR